MAVADLRQELRLARFAESLRSFILLTEASGFHHRVFRTQVGLLVQVVLAFIDVKALQVHLHGRISHQIGTTLQSLTILQVIVARVAIHSTAKMLMRLFSGV